MLQGISKTFYTNGNPEVERKFVDGIRHGTTKIYHDDGSLALEAFYIDDKLQGDVLIYDKRKILRVRDTYINDELVNRIKLDYKGIVESKEELVKSILIQVDWNLKFIMLMH